MSETTTDTLAEIEEQAADYTPPEGWRVLQAGEVLEGEDWLIDPRNGKRRPTLRLGHKVEHQIYIRRIEPEPEQTITSADVAAEAINEWPSVKLLRQEMEATELALLEQQQRNEQLVTQGSQQHMEIAELQAQVRFLKGREVTLGTRLEEEKAVTAKRLQQVEELRSEVSYVQGLLGEEKRRFAELETLTSDLRAVNAATEKAINSAAREKADLEHRLDTVAAEWAVQAETIRELQTQLEAVKAELVQERLERNQWQNQVLQVTAEQVLRVTAELEDKTSECRNLRIELDAAQQVPADSPELRQLRADLAEVTRERDQYLDSYQRIFGDLETIRETTKAAAVEAIAEWLEPVRLVDNPNLANETLQHLPQIMRSLVGLDTPEDVD